MILNGVFYALKGGGKLDECKKYKFWHSLKIKNGEISLDDFQLRGVLSYELKIAAHGPAELTLKIKVNNTDVNID